MSHQKIQEKRFSFFDKELSSTEIQEIREHLNICAECKAVYEHSEKVSKLFFKSFQIETHPSFVPKVMERIANEAKQHVFIPLTLKRFFSAFGLALSIALLLLTYFRQNEPVSIETLVFSKNHPSFEIMFGANAERDNWFINTQEEL